MATPDYILNLREHIGTELIMMPTVAAIIFDASGAVLLQKRSDNGNWGIPGGMIEPGEEPAEAIVREVHEETGLWVVPERITGVYGGKSQVGQYPNGDQYAMTNITFECKIIGGTLTPDGDETLELRYFPTDALPENVIPRHQLRIEHARTLSQTYFNKP